MWLLVTLALIALFFSRSFMRRAIPHDSVVIFFVVTASAFILLRLGELG